MINRNVQRFRGGLAFKAHRLCVSLNSRLESNREEEKDDQSRSNAPKSNMDEALGRTDLRFACNSVDAAVFGGVDSTGYVRGTGRGPPRGFKGAGIRGASTGAPRP